MANTFIASAHRREVSDIRGFFMRHVSGSDVGFSWDQNDSRYPADQWERIPAGAVALANLSADVDFEMRKVRTVHEFLLWNRAQTNPAVEVTKEYSVASKVLELAGLAGLLVQDNEVASAGLLGEARRALRSLLDAVRGVHYVEATHSFGQQVLDNIEAANVEAESAAAVPVTVDSSEGADARLVCRVAREAGTPVSVETARAILAALSSQAASGPGAAPQSKED